MAAQPRLQQNHDFTPVGEREPGSAASMSPSRSSPERADCRRTVPGSPEDALNVATVLVLPGSKSQAPGTFTQLVQRLQTRKCVKEPPSASQGLSLLLLQLYSQNPPLWSTLQLSRTKPLECEFTSKQQKHNGETEENGAINNLPETRMSQESSCCRGLLCCTQGISCRLPISRSLREIVKPTQLCSLTPQAFTRTDVYPPPPQLFAFPRTQNLPAFEGLHCYSLNGAPTQHTSGQLQCETGRRLQHITAM